MYVCVCVYAHVHDTILDVFWVTGGFAVWAGR